MYVSVFALIFTVLNIVYVYALYNLDYLHVNFLNSLMNLTTAIMAIVGGVADRYSSTIMLHQIQTPLSCTLS